MTIASFTKNKIFNDEKITVQLILETSFSKEIRILLKEGQVMKEHQAPLPIIVHILEGKIDFGIKGEVQQLQKGDLIALKARVPHDLHAKENSVVRLSLSKLDSAERVQQVIQN